MEIIAGVWAVLLVIPMDAKLYKFFTGTASYTLSMYYWIFFGCYTTFFIISGALVPVIKRHRIIETLNELVKDGRITTIQKEKIFQTIQNVSSYQTLTSKTGILQFVMENIFSISVMFAYFGIEGIIGNILTHETLIVPVIFVILFLALLIIRSFLDDYLSDQMKYKQRRKKINTLWNGNKTILMQLVEDIGGGSSNSDKIGQIVLEETIDDITKIINISGKKKHYKNSNVRHKQKYNNNYTNNSSIFD